MNIVSKFEYPILDRVTNLDGTRFYTCPETKNPLASVTTILSATADKKFLVEWRKRIGDKEADRQSSYGSGLGSLVHENIENHILGIERPRGNAPMRVLSRQMADRIIDECLPHVDEVWGIETPLYYPGLFAGTTDLCGLYRGVPSIMDHKNTKKMKTKEQIIDYRDQLSAYIIAHNARYGTDIKQGVVFMVSRALEVKTHIWNADEIKEGCDSFMDRVEQYLNSI
jgi:genome maintenance exonuclease 1